MSRYIKIVILSIVGFLAVHCGGRAETVSSRQAKNMAQQFFNEAAGRIVAPVKMVYNGRRLTTDRLFVPFYVYNQPSGGFVIISAENKAFPILGYSLRDSFDPDKMGEITKSLLASYAHEIEMVRYDSTIPEDVIAAWIDYPKYVRGTLDELYDATDPNITKEEAASIINIDSSLYDFVYADIYTPAQWMDILVQDLNLKKTVPIGFYDKKNLYPVLVHGRKGDYFRMELDERNSWLMRLNATETIPGLMVGAFQNISIPEEYISDGMDPDSEEFEFLDSFVSEVAEVETERKLSRTMNLEVSEPVVRGMSGGHYEIVMPENVVMATIYNLGGAILSQSTYSDTNTIYLDISPEPSGFYFGRLIGESGKSYGVKLVR